MVVLEIWKDIIGYEGFYQISNLGNVRSLDREVKGGRHLKGKLKKHKIDRCGYHFVRLCKNGGGKNFSIHRLVAIHFIPNPNNLPEVNHIDEDKNNNCITNLEWCTRTQNMSHGTLPYRSRHYKNKPVVQFTLEGEFVMRYEITTDTKDFGFQPSHVQDCARGVRKTHKGFIWKYEEDV